MATPDLDAYIGFLRQELPDMLVLAMPGVRHVGLMHCALPSRDAAAARHAMARLLSAPGGGILVVPVAKGGLAADPDRVLRALRALVAEEAPGAIVDEQVVELCEGPAVCVQLDPGAVEEPAAVPAEGEAVEGAGVYDLETGPLAGLGLPPDGVEVGGAWLTPMEALLVRQGAAVVDEGLVVPTVAGLVALGKAPARWLPGMRVRLEAGRGAWVEGSLREIVATVVRHPELRGFPAEVVKELVLNAFLHRDWRAREVPVRVRVAGRRLEVMSPGFLADGGAAPNPRLRALARQAGLASGRGRGLVAVGERLRDLGWHAVDLDEVDGEVWASVEARPAKAVEKPVPIAQARPVPAAPRPVSATARPRSMAAPAPRPAPAIARLPAPAAAVPPPPPEPSTQDAASARDEAVVALARERGTLTTRDVQEVLGWSRSSTRDTLARLVEAGALTRLAASPRSPNQCYRLAG